MVSKKPRKQRKLLHTAPLHLRRKFVSAHLSKDLRQAYKRRSLPVRTGDEVQVMRGSHAGKVGKVSKVDLKAHRIYVEGVTDKRTVGTDVQVPLQPSKLRITTLVLEDALRRKVLQRKVHVPEKVASK
jgi:large subunit ribosomal protein L24